jgi:ketosteroid isomerase-like protein
MSIAEDTTSVVGAYYPAGVRGELPAFRPHLAAEFSVTAPDYLPWGGTDLGKAFLDDVLHHLPENLDFSRVRYDSFTAEGTHAVALITIGIADAPHTVKISEHWEVKDALAQSIWVAYFQPQALLDKLGIAHGLSHSCA